MSTSDVLLFGPYRLDTVNGDSGGGRRPSHFRPRSWRYSVTLQSIPGEW
jgi:hypothetical protein